MTNSSLSYFAADTSVDLVDLTAGGLLRTIAGEEADRIALVEISPSDIPPLVDGVATGTRTWTYAELLTESEQTAQWLLTKFKPGEHICVWAPNIAEWVILQYGAALAGLVLVTANPALRASELEYVLNQSNSAGIIYVNDYRGSNMAGVVEAALPRVPHLRAAISFANWNTEVREFAGPEHPLPHVRPTDLAQIQYTSGTTGFPKGAMLHHRGLITNAAYVHRRAEFPKYGVWATGLPMFHTAGCGMSVLGTANSRGTIVILQTFTPTLALEAIASWKADLFGGVPAMFAAILATDGLEEYDLSSVKVTASGGDAVPEPMARRVEEVFGSRFSTVYGQTELSPIIAQTSPLDENAKRLGTTGRPLWQVELKIIDPSDGSTVERGVTGEICARGYQTMLGYFDMPDETAETIDSEGWLHTGDLGVLEEDDFLVVTGRLKDMIIRGGENIYPREIEAVLQTHPAVDSAVVFGRPDDQWGESVVAVVIAGDPAAPPTQDDLRRLVREHLAPHKTPKEWFVTDVVPTNAMGKIQKFKLREAMCGLQQLA